MFDGQGVDAAETRFEARNEPADPGSNDGSYDPEAPSTEANRDDR